MQLCHTFSDGTGIGRLFRIFSLRLANGSFLMYTLDLSHGSMFRRYIELTFPLNFCSEISVSVYPPDRIETGSNVINGILF